VGRGNAQDQDSAKARKMLENAARTRQSGACCVGGRLGTQDSKPERRYHRQIDNIIARVPAVFN